MKTIEGMKEFKIHVKDTPKEYVDGLILGLIHSGYSTYLGWDREDVCFQGWRDEVMCE